jgi:putative endonuclease
LGWWVYIIEADDGSLYTGITTDVARRFAEHQAGQKRAKFFNGRTPVRVVYRESAESRSMASRREAAIKKLDRASKLKLLVTFGDGPKG